MKSSCYRGRIAPSPTGYLHLGHVATFLTAAQRAKQMDGSLIFRNEDIDPLRCKEAYSIAAMEDLRWLGFDWQEGPDVGGLWDPYVQSKRFSSYLNLWKSLKEKGVIYPCSVSRKELRDAIFQSEDNEKEPVFPKQLRPHIDTGKDMLDPGGMVWRFRVPDDEMICFDDGRSGKHCFLSGKDFGDFVVWRKENVPSYELAVVADDHAMEITEVVRGEDLLLSTARQMLIYRILGWNIPSFYHCPLVRDNSGKRLAKRYDSLSIRDLRHSGKSSEEILGIVRKLQEQNAG